MTITFNGQVRPSGLITYTDIPNILKVEDTDAGTRAVMTLLVTNNLSYITTEDGQWNITILGESISNVINVENAVSKNFYIGNSNATTAASICRALRNCPTIAANFKVMNDGNAITLTARSIGPVFSTNYFDTNIPTDYISYTVQDGTAASSLFASKIDVDIYSGNEYITTLEKNYYGSEAAFNLSPVLTSISEIGKSTPYTLRLSSINKNGEYNVLGNVSTNYSVVGYMVNQGFKYQYLGSSTPIAQNVLRGQNRDVYNNSLLYVYEPSLVFSYCSSDSNPKNITVHYLDSAFNEISSFVYTYTPAQTDNIIKDVEIPLTGEFALAFYVDIEMNDNRIRYNVIKPLKMTEYCQRIYFRNSYGGVSFFDFTGQKTETRDLDIMTYSKSIFDYYTDDMNELEKVYDSTVKYTVSLKSHLFENDGKYIFNDMLQTPEAWVVRNGEKYAIIIDSISVDESQNNNNIFEATLRYHYSQEPSLI